MRWEIDWISGLVCLWMREGEEEEEEEEKGIFLVGREKREEGVRTIRGAGLPRFL